MQILKNLKHIFFIIVLALTLLFGGVLLLGRDFLFPINGYFIYRTGDVTEYHGEEEKTHTIWQDNIYRHTLTPSENIVLVTIDDASINALQVRHNGSMLTIAKSVYDE